MGRRLAMKTTDRIPRTAGSTAKDPERPDAAGAQRGTAITPSARRRMVAEAAYFLAERRGFACGFELADWLDAERDVDTMLRDHETERPASHPRSRPRQTDPGQ